MSETPDLEPLGELLDRHASAGDFEADWALAQDRADAWRWRRALPLVAAALVLLFVGVRMAMPEDPGGSEQASTAPEVAVVGEKLGYGHVRVLKRSPTEVSVVDPGVLQVTSSPDGLLLMAVGPGRTDVVVVEGEQAPEILTFTVVDEPVSPNTSGWVDVPYAGSLLVEGTYSAIQLVDPSVLSAVQLDGRVVLQAVGPGRSDVVLQEEGRTRVVSVAVGEGKRRHGLVVRPDATPIAMAYGQAHLLEGPVPKGVMVVDPAVLSARTVNGRVLLEAHGVGATDVVVTEPLRVYRVTVE